MSRSISVPTARRLAGCGAIGLLAVAWSAPGHTETVPPQARAHFRAGVAHLQSLEPERSAQAYREFKAAYAEFPSWKILGNLGVAAHRLERYGEAIDAFEEYLKKGGTEVDAKEAEQVRRDLQQIRAEQATVTVEAPKSPFWILDTRTAEPGPVVNQYGPFEGRSELHVRAGDHHLRFDGDGDAVPAWTVHLLPGDASVHIFEPNQSRALSSGSGSEDSMLVLPDPDVQRDEGPAGSHTGAYLLWGLGAAGTVAATVFYLQGSHVQSEADAAFRRNCPDELASSPGCVHVTGGDKTAAHWNTAALLTGLGAAGALIAGTTLYFFGGPSRDSSSRGNVETPVSLRAWIDVGGVGLSGTF